MCTDDRLTVNDLLEVERFASSWSTAARWRCCVASTQGRLKANLRWNQIAETSSSNGTAPRRLVGSSTASS